MNVTLTVDVRSWFASAGALVDPASANPGGQNENLVKENIERSFRSFEDDNCDGREEGDGR